MSQNIDDVLVKIILCHYCLIVTVDHKRRKGLGPKQSLVFSVFAEELGFSLTYNFCFKQLEMNFIYIGSLASSIRSTATIKQFIRPSLYR